MSIWHSFPLHAHLHSWEFMVDKHSQPYGRDHQKLCPKCVMIGVVGCLEFDEHEIQCPIGCYDEDHFHHRIVHWNKVGEDIKISRCEDQRKQHLALARYACVSEKERERERDGACVSEKVKEVGQVWMRGGVEKGKPVLGGSDISLYNPPGLSSYHTTDLLRVLCTFLGCKKSLHYGSGRSFVSPAQERVLHILTSRMMMASKWKRSPASLKTFIFTPAFYYTQWQLCVWNRTCLMTWHLCIRTTPPCFMGARPHPLTRRARGGHDIISLGKSCLVPSASGVWGRDYRGKLNITTCIHIQLLFQKFCC